MLYTATHTCFGVYVTNISEKGDQDKVIRVIQVNTQHAKQAQIELANRMDKMQDNYIFLIQEPYLQKNRLGLKPRTCNTFCGSTEYTRTAIYACKSLHIWPLMHLSHRDCTAVTTVINKRTTIIASVYLDYHQEVIQP